MNILIRIKNFDKIYIINKLISNRIFYRDLVIKDNYIFIKTDINNINMLKRIFISKNIKIIKYYGKENIIRFIKKEYLFILSFLFGIIIIYLISNTILNINVISNEDLNDKIVELLEKKDIKKHSFHKKYEEIELIKESILKDNKDLFEWIEIERKGTLLNIYYEKRVEEQAKESNKPSNIIASKDALILNMTTYSGEPLKEKYDYVKKGDVLISGNIKLNDKIVKTKPSFGVIYGEVWYTVKTTIPYKYVEYTMTDKVINHYYLDFNSFKMTLFGKYNKEDTMSNEIVLLDKYFFKLIKEEKSVYEYREYNLNKEDAEKEAIKRSDRSIENTLEDKEYVIDKKVLNIEHFSSKMNIVIFYKVYENITEYQLIEKGSGNFGSNSN